METTEDFKQSSDLTALLTFAGPHCREAGTSAGKADGETSAQGQARLQVLKGQKRNTRNNLRWHLTVTKSAPRAVRMTSC